MMLTFSQELRPAGAGFFRSRGEGRHMERVMDSFELILVRQGVLSIAEGAKRFEVGAGETLILRPGVSHRGTADYAADLRFFWGHFRPGTRRIRPLRVPQHGHPRNPERLAELFGHYFEEQERGLPCRRTAAWILEGWLLEAGRPAEETLPASPIVRLAIERVADRFAEPGFGPSVVGADLQLNPDYLERVFKRDTGRTLGEEILRRRISHARRLLRESSRNVDQVACACGFANAGWFRRIFLREVGVSPLVFRQQFTRTLINVD